MYASGGGGGGAKFHLPFNILHTFISSIGPQSFAPTVLAARCPARVPPLAKVWGVWRGPALHVTVPPVTKPLNGEEARSVARFPDVCPDHLGFPDKRFEPG